MPDSNQNRYPEPKQRELSDSEKEEIRVRLARGESDIFQIARDLACSASQVAGIKAALHR